MFSESAGCQLVGTDYTSKHQRVALWLLPPDGTPKFRAAFTSVAAYQIDKTHLGSVVAEVEAVPVADLILRYWDCILAANLAGIWPGPTPSNGASASAFALHVGLRGFKIAFESGYGAWAISHDYVLLGQRLRPNSSLKSRRSSSAA
jgi:hypothetical protein